MVGDGEDDDVAGGGTPCARGFGERREPDEQDIDAERFHRLEKIYRKGEAQGEVAIGRLLHELCMFAERPLPAISVAGKTLLFDLSSFFFLPRPSFLLPASSSSYPLLAPPRPLVR